MTSSIVLFTNTSVCVFTVDAIYVLFTNTSVCVFTVDVDYVLFTNTPVCVFINHVIITTVSFTFGTFLTLRSLRAFMHIAVELII